ncbi:MAG: hypothetical protein RL557_367 [archaeon]
MKPTKLSKQEIQEQIEKTFSGKPSAEEIKKIKKLAMSKNIKLGELRKKFCSKCLSYFNPQNSEIRIKKGMKMIKCKKCGQRSRWKMKNLYKM